MPDPRDPKPASVHTARANAAAGATLRFDDDGEWERATRGLVTTHPTGAFDGPLGTAWDVAEYDFLRDEEQAPPSVHPSLWRQGRLNSVHGLFAVAAILGTLDEFSGVFGIVEP
jgi:alkyl sulfatase BDS1-like metallo-beta-lactamase superfamily hydrolase